MVERIKLQFTNESGEKLAGLLEMPPPGTQAIRFAVFAHCFTCGKDSAAASRIAISLPSGSPRSNNAGISAAMAG